MANQLNEMETDQVNKQGRDVNVIEKQLPMQVGKGSLVFEIILWCLLLLPGFIFWILKIKAKNNLNKLEQRVQAAASEIDNALEQRVVILENAASLLKKSTDLDKSTFTEIARLRSGAKSDVQRNQFAEQLDALSRQVNVAFEAYPDLKSQSTIADVMQQNNYLQREITATRTNYNDLVSRWNQNIQVWPTYKIVAAKMGLTTRIPFTASTEIKQRARTNFFDN